MKRRAEPPERGRVKRRARGKISIRRHIPHWPRCGGGRCTSPLGRTEAAPAAGPLFRAKAPRSPRAQGARAEPVRRSGESAVSPPRARARHPPGRSPVQTKSSQRLDVGVRSASVGWSRGEAGRSVRVHRVRLLGRAAGSGSARAATRSGRSSRRSSARSRGAKAPPKPLLRLVDVEVEEAARISTGVPELDRVLGGGLVPASLVLVGGEPGVGKSTLLLTALQAMSADRRTLLITGEESVAQVKLRAERLGGAANVEILAETELDVVCETLEAERPDVCVIDSVQTLYSAELGSAPGSVAQVREAAGAAAARREGDRRRDDPRRPRHEGRRGRRPARARAPRRLRAPVRGRPLPRAPRAARGEEPLRLDERARRLRDDRRRARRRARPVRGLRPHGRRRAGRRRRLRARGHAADPARGAGARRARATSRCRGASPPASTRSGSR